jgi:hypothetical protein
MQARVQAKRHEWATDSSWSVFRVTLVKLSQFPNIQRLGRTALTTTRQPNFAREQPNTSRRAAGTELSTRCPLPGAFVGRCGCEARLRTSCAAVSWLASRADARAGWSQNCTARPSGRSARLSAIGGNSVYCASPRWEMPLGIAVRVGIMGETPRRGILLSPQAFSSALYAPAAHGGPPALLSPASLT